MGGDGAYGINYVRVFSSSSSSSSSRSRTLPRPRHWPRVLFSERRHVLHGFIPYTRTIPPRIIVSSSSDAGVFRRTDRARVETIPLVLSDPRGIGFVIYRAPVASDFLISRLFGRRRRACPTCVNIRRKTRDHTARDTGVGPRTRVPGQATVDHGVRVLSKTLVPPDPPPSQTGAKRTRLDVGAAPRTRERAIPPRRALKRHVKVGTSTSVPAAGFR